MQAPIPIDKLRDYIAYARKRCNPELTEPAARLLVQSYKDMRATGSSRKVSLHRLAEENCGEPNTESFPLDLTPNPCAAPHALTADLECAHRCLEGSSCEFCGAGVGVGGVGVVGVQVITATPRQLESLVRLSEAQARMHLSPTVEERHVQEALRLMQVARLAAVISALTATLGQVHAHAFKEGRAMSGIHLH